MFHLSVNHIAELGKIYLKILWEILFFKLFQFKKKSNICSMFSKFPHWWYVLSDFEFFPRYSFVYTEFWVFSCH